MGGFQYKAAFKAFPTSWPPILLGAPVVLCPSWLYPPPQTHQDHGPDLGPGHGSNPGPPSQPFPVPLPNAVQKMAFISSKAHSSVSSMKSSQPLLSWSSNAACVCVCVCVTVFIYIYIHVCAFTGSPSLPAEGNSFCANWVLNPRCVN